MFSFWSVFALNQKEHVSVLSSYCLSAYFCKNNDICAGDAQRNLCFVFDMEIPEAPVKHQKLQALGAACLAHVCEGLQGFPT